MADFFHIQEAVDRARSGDIILLLHRLGFGFDDFTIDGKSLTIINESGTWEIDPALVLQRITLRNITGSVVLRGLFVGRIEAESSSGTIWVERSAFDHLYLQNCSSVMVSGCNRIFGFDIIGSNSNVAVWDSDLSGARGTTGGADTYCTYDYCSYIGNCAYGYRPGCGYSDFQCIEIPPPTGDGEPAVWLTGTSSLFLSGSTVAGGAGGYSGCGYSPDGQPGPAVRTTSTSSITYLDSAFTGHVPLIEGGPTITDYARTSGSYTVSSPLLGGADATATLEGQPDTQVFVVANPDLTIASAPLRFGLLVLRLADSPSMYLGRVPTDGSPIVSSFPVGDLGPGEGSVLFTQSMFVEDLGGGVSETVLGAPSVLLQID